MFDISLVPVCVSTIVAMGVGAVWYSPAVFGAVWMKEAGITESDTASRDALWRMVLASAIQNFVIVYILAHLLLLADAYVGTSELVLGVWVVILVAATQLGSVIWENKSLTYFSINAGYLSAVLLLATLIMTEWPWA